MYADGAGDDTTPASAASNTSGSATPNALLGTLEVLLWLMKESLAERIGEMVFLVCWVARLTVLKVGGVKDHDHEDPVSFSKLGDEFIALLFRQTIQSSLYLNTG